MSRCRQLAISSGCDSDRRINGINLGEALSASVRAVRSRRLRHGSVRAIRALDARK